MYKIMSTIYIKKLSNLSSVNDESFLPLIPGYKLNNFCVMKSSQVISSMRMELTCISHTS
jgi:hypothetical protein